MKSGFSEAIFTFQRKLRLQLVIALLLMAAIVGTRLLWSPEGDFEKGCLSVGVMAGVLMLAIFAYRRYTLSHFLKDHTSEKNFNGLQAEINSASNYYKGTSMIRFVAGVVFVLSTLAFVFMEGKSYFTGMVFTGCILFVLGSFLYGWILMTDEMSLQDLKHHLKDQPSDIS